MEKDLRSHHFYLKDKQSKDKVNEDTVYRNNYNWKTNPDGAPERIKKYS